MCKNHDQLHYHPLLREAAYIMAAQDAETRDALLLAATWEGLEQLMERLSDYLQPGEIVRIRSRLAAVKVEREARSQSIAKRLVARLEAGRATDKVPW